MSLPVSQYEALLEEMRGLRRKAQHVQQLATPLISSNSSTIKPSSTSQHACGNRIEIKNDLLTSLNYNMDSVVVEMQRNTTGTGDYNACISSGAEGDTTCSEDECCAIGGTHLSVSSEPISHRNRAVNSLYHGTWPVERTMWTSEPSNSAPSNKVQNMQTRPADMTSVMSFASSSGGAPLDRVLGSPDRSRRSSSSQLEAKVDMIYSLLAMLGGQEHADMGETLLALSTNPESCLAMRQSGCIPLLVQLVQSDKDSDTRRKASQALDNLISAQPDEKIKKREVKIFKLLEQARCYTETLRTNISFQLDSSASQEEDGEGHPVQTVAHLMKLSFDEGHRQAVCQFGGINTISNLIEAEHCCHGSITDDSHCILLRRYACMTLTNLTFGDSGNKALLCSYREFMRALVLQLQSSSDELRQVTASVLRNLSWRADSTSKDILREVGTVTGLMKAAMVDSKENTLKSILSALWNLSAHSTENKAEICAIDGALGFLVDMLSYKTPSKTLAIIENSGGILRNISSQIAVRDDYREILRKHNCLQVLLNQLKSPSLTIVSNACGTLWNLSAKCAADQELLWQLGAPAMLRSLNNSKHKMIAMGSSAALKNLLSSKPTHGLMPQIDSTARAMDLPVLPTLGARKQKALLQDLGQNLTETFDNVEKVENELKNAESTGKSKSNKNKKFLRSGSHECVSRSEFNYENRTTRSDTSGCKTKELCNAFASLSVCDASTSYQSDLRKTSRLPQYYGSSSLPFAPSRSPCTFIPVRNNYSDCDYEDEVVNEEPVDYSRKYSESKMPKSVAKDYKSSRSKLDEVRVEETAVKIESESYGIYAETDLDQPTDYSLRYAEDDSDSDICTKVSKTEGSEFVQDTVKTYCTEGTPYETPFNFSTATSMSDLRIGIESETEKDVIDNDKQTNVVVKREVKIPTLSHLDEKDHCSVEDISDTDSQQKNLALGKVKSEFSSGLMSPEKPINYCEEGTPGYFSRVSSFGSLASIPANEAVKVEEKMEKLEAEESEEKKSKVLQKCETSPTEGKAVKFEQVVNYAEETPLMFSRSSSLASLDSIDQHSIHDDRSSIVSDFSRLTSGIVSPSELPDSPTQTVPPSPKPRKNPLEYPSGSRQHSGAFSKNSVLRPQPAPRLVQKFSVFEDNVTKFKEESTPVQFSTATSLSSLTIDDEPNIPIENQGNTQRTSVNEPVPQEEEVEKQDVEKEKLSSALEYDDELPILSDDDDDENILSACINIGMQTKRSHPKLQDSPPRELPPHLQKYDLKHRMLTSNIPMPKSGIPKLTNTASNNFRTIQTVQTSAAFSPPCEVYSDSLKTYCTENTPAHLSHAGSSSNLSVLSMLDKGKADYVSDDGSNLSEDNEKLLNDCIKSGMPQRKPDSSNHSRLTTGTANLNTSGGTTNKQYFTSEKNRNISGYGHSGLRIKEGKKRLPVYSHAKDEFENYAVENTPIHYSLRSSLSDLTVDGSVIGLTRTVPAGCSSTEESPQTTGTPNQFALYNQGKSNNEPCSEPSPSSSKKVEMKFYNPSQNEATNLSRQGSLSSLSIGSLESVEAEQELLQQCIASGMPKKKESSGSIELGKPKLPPRPVYPVLSNASSPKQVPKRSKEQRMPQVEGQIISEVSSNLSSVRKSNPKNVNVASAAGNTTQINNVSPEIPATVAGVEHVGESEKDLKHNHVKQGTDLDMSQNRYSPLDENSGTERKKSGSDISSFNDEIMDSNEELSPKIVDNRMLDPDAMIESLDRFTAELVSQASHLQKEENLYATSVTEGSTWNEDTSPNDLTFPSISGSAPNVISFKSEDGTQDVVDGVNETEPEHQSNDFSSINTSTLTESTLIAMEATKVATAFRMEADMSHSLASATSLELDHVQPPSNLNSLTNSVIDSKEIVPKSPKLTSRKKSLPASLMIRKALSNSLNQASSLESLENHSLSNLDRMNPPSAMAELLDMVDLEGSMTSVASIPSEVADVKNDFLINGFTSKKFTPNLSHIASLSDIENVNPPSLFHEITDMCNSLADVSTEGICTETEVFEDCYTHVDATLQATDITEYSDANSITPIHSDASSAESTPKKTSGVSKTLTAKQRRNLAKERYKTYTVAAEMVMKDSISEQNQITEYASANSSKNDGSGKNKKITPKERRQNDRSRFDTRVVDVSEIVLQECESKIVNNSPSKNKIGIRRNFLQKRLENKERFKTQTLNDSMITDISGSSPETNSSDLHYLVQKEANLVLKTLGETKSHTEEFLDCETLSLVSNEDDSENNSCSSVNYRTYHKSWGMKGNKIPIIQSSSSIKFAKDPLNCNSNLTDDQNSDELIHELDDLNKPLKPKIVKPSATGIQEEIESKEPEVKTVRGRRKPLYTKSNVKPIKTMTSNLVKNVTSSLKSTANLKLIVPKTHKNVTKPLQEQNAIRALKPPTGYKATQKKTPVNSKPNSPQTKSPIRTSLTSKSVNVTKPKTTPPVRLERQGTFTKEEPNSSVNKSKIPTPSSSNSKVLPSRIAKSVNPPKTGLAGRTSVSSDRSQSAPSRKFQRSPSVDSKDRTVNRVIQNSVSSQSLKNEPSKLQKSPQKRSSIPNVAQRSNSNSSLSSNNSSVTKKQVTSKIASLWKKIEQSKKQPPKNDTRIWIQPDLTTSNCETNNDETLHTVTLRNKAEHNDNTPKRVSRLGSFVVMDEDERPTIMQ